MRTFFLGCILQLSIAVAVPVQDTTKATTPVRTSTTAAAPRSTITKCSTAHINGCQSSSSSAKSALASSSTSSTTSASTRSSISSAASTPGNNTTRTSVLSTASTTTLSSTSSIPLLGFPGHENYATEVLTIRLGSDPSTSATVQPSKRSIETAVVPDTKPKPSQTFGLSPTSIPPRVRFDDTQASAKDTAVGGWRNASCGMEGLTDATSNAWDRWRVAGAALAWDEAVIYANKTVNSRKLSFPELISNFFQGPEKMKCGQVSARSACATEVRCFEPPAAYLILNSMVALSNYNYNLWSAVLKAESGLALQAGSFASTFGYLSGTQQTKKVMADAMSFGYALFASPLLTGNLKTAVEDAASPSESQARIREWVSPAVSSGVALARDSNSAGLAINAENDIGNTISRVAKTWSRSIQQYNRIMFDGSTSSVGFIGWCIKNGQALDADYTVDESEVALKLERSFFSILIPRAWRMNNAGLAVFILNSGMQCGPGALTLTYINETVLPPALAEKSSACINNSLYYLLATPPAPSQKPLCADTARATSFMSQNPSAGNITNTFCGESNSTVTTPFSPVPGADQLDGTNWGGITKEDIIAGALNTFTMNKNKNGDMPIDISSYDAISELARVGVRSPGLVNIPVCQSDEAYANWRAQKTSLKNYPCN